MMQRHLFNFGSEEEETPPDFEAALNAEELAQLAERRSNPFGVLLQEIQVRALVNGEGKAVREKALNLLFHGGLTNEGIETKLLLLSRSHPDTFNPSKVDATISWVNNRWQQRIDQIKRKPR